MRAIDADGHVQEPSEATARRLPPSGGHDRSGLPAGRDRCREGLSEGAKRKILRENPPRSFGLNA
jgi:hypothetical protein